MTSAKFTEFLTPSPLVDVANQLILFLLSAPSPAPPHTADVIFGSPLIWPAEKVLTFMAMLLQVLLRRSQTVMKDARKYTLTNQSSTPSLSALKVEHKTKDDLRVKLKGTDTNIAENPMFIYLI